jgi:hypothetical protein
LQEAALGEPRQSLIFPKFSLIKWMGLRISACGEIHGSVKYSKLTLLILE